MNSNSMRCSIFDGRFGKNKKLRLRSVQEARNVQGLDRVAVSGAARRATAKIKTARIAPRRSAVTPVVFVQRAAAQCRRFPLPA
jgi:hypothetical protein